MSAPESKLEYKTRVPRSFEASSNLLSILNRSALYTHGVVLVCVPTTASKVKRDFQPPSKTISRITSAPNRSPALAQPGAGRRHRPPSTTRPLKSFSDPKPIQVRHPSLSNNNMHIRPRQLQILARAGRDRFLEVHALPMRSLGSAPGRRHFVPGGSSSVLFAEGSFLVFTAV